MSSDLTPPLDPEAPAPGPRHRRPLMSRRLTFAIAGVAILAVGAAAGAGAVGLARHHEVFTPAALGPVTGMQDWASVTIKGSVAEIFGNKFILQDQTGRALVETGPSGEDGNLVAKDEPVTVEGRFEHGFVHAVVIVHADGKSVEIAPPHGPPHGPGGWLHRIQAP